MSVVQKLEHVVLKLHGGRCGFAGILLVSGAQVTSCGDSAVRCLFEVEVIVTMRETLEQRKGHQGCYCLTSRADNYLLSGCLQKSESCVLASLYQAVVIQLL